jgi:hypothetical protein
MQEAQVLAPLLEPLGPLFAWIAAHPAAAVGAITAVPLGLTLAVLLFGRRPAPPPASPQPASPQPAPREPAPSSAEPVVLEAPVRAEPLPTPVAPTPVAPPRPVAPPAPVPIAPPPRVEPPPPKPVAPPPARLFDRLARTRTALVGGIGRLLAGRRLEGDAVDEL